MSFAFLSPLKVMNFSTRLTPMEQNGWLLGPLWELSFALSQVFAIAVLQNWVYHGSVFYFTSFPQFNFFSWKINSNLESFLKYENDINKIVTALPSGELKFCCGLTIRQIEGLTAGRWDQQSLDTLIRQTPDDLLKLAIQTIGPRRICEDLLLKIILGIFLLANKNTDFTAANPQTSNFKNQKS